MLIKTTSGIGKTWFQFILLNWQDKDVASLLTALEGDEVSQTQRWTMIEFPQVVMSWSSAQQKNYLHLAAERGLASSLKLLLESAR